MAKGQAWITTKGKMGEVVNLARKTFPDTTNDSQALTRALLRWFYDQEENSKVSIMQRIEKKIDRLLNALEPGK